MVSVASLRLCQMYTQFILQLLWMGSNLLSSDNWAITWVATILPWYWEKKRCSSIDIVCWTSCECTYALQRTEVLLLRSDHSNRWLVGIKEAVCARHPLSGVSDYSALSSVPRRLNTQMPGSKEKVQVSLRVKRCLIHWSWWAWGRVTWKIESVKEIHSYHHAISGHGYCF